MLTLQPNSSLQGGKYKILQSLGQGGFGITYLAVQTGLDRKVAIKEFFMKDYCNRDEATSHVSIGSQGSVEMVNRYREKFFKEAHNIARLKHSNIVKVIDVFEENGTAYYVMEYAACGSLSDRVKKDGYLSEPVATRYILQIADALDYIHQQKMTHLDVKPANVMLNEKDEPVIIDFGLSKQYDAKTGNQTSSTPVGISEGYAPMEQYKQGGVGEFSPETDVYALGATYYKLLTGITPPSASDVYEDDLPVDELKAKNVSQKAINAICSAMEPLKKNRMKSAREFMDMLKGDVEYVAADVETVETAISPYSENVDAIDRQEDNLDFQESDIQIPEKPVKRIKKWLWMAIGIVAVVAIVFIVLSKSSKQEIISKTFTVNGVSFDMMLVESGTFTMSESSEQRPDDYYGDLPHKVTLTKSYYIGKTEVTQALWKAVMNNNTSLHNGEKLPVENVTYDECQEFIMKLNKLTGKKFRLPTDAEWEFAARGGNNSNKCLYSGSNELYNVAWYEQNSGYKPHEVAAKQPNELGIYDMSGNVREWVNDWRNVYRTDDQIDPTGPKIGNDRVIRGGSCSNFPKECSLSDRDADEPRSCDGDLGFRLCLSE